MQKNGRTPSVGIRVLVVDDQADARWAASLGLMAEPAMQMVGLVRPGPDAIRGAAEHSPDLVLLDADGPWAAALELLRRLKARSAAPRVVVVADAIPAALRVAMLEAGADGVVERRGFALPLLALVDRFFPPVNARFAIAERHAPSDAFVAVRSSQDFRPRRVPYRRVPRGERAVN